MADQAHVHSVGKLWDVLSAKASKGNPYTHAKMQLREHVRSWDARLPRYLSSAHELASPVGHCGISIENARVKA